MSKKPFIKITEEDISIAREFFEDESLLKDWIYNVVQYYMGNEPIHTDKLEEKYFNAYKKTMDFIMSAKKSGFRGGIKRVENQGVDDKPFKGTSREPSRSVKGTLQANNKLETNNKKEESINSSSDSENPFDIPIDEFPFEDFWNIYDKKTGRHKCEQKWGKLNKSDKKKIMDILPAYVASKPDKKFRPHPERFINGKLWEDEIITDTVKEEESEQQIQEKYERDQRIAQAFFDKVKADRELREAESKRN